jgi:CopG family nickel-responsive transcriptional regulator
MFARMKDSLVRFGVAMEEPLLADLDALVAARGVTRSEVLRDLVRAEVSRANVGRGVPAVAALTLVYDHHVRDLSEKLTAMQHDLGDRVRSTLHVHLDHDNCLEVIVLSGRSDELQKVADRLLATRGVKQGGIEIIAGVPRPRARPARPQTATHDHDHARPNAQPHAKKSTPRSAR